jgi:hypothetical protein
MYLEGRQGGQNEIHPDRPPYTPDSHSGYLHSFSGQRVRAFFLIELITTNYTGIDSQDIIYLMVTLDGCFLSYVGAFH